MTYSTDASGGDFQAKLEIGADATVKTSEASSNGVYARKGASISFGNSAETGTLEDSSLGVLAYYTDASGANGKTFVSMADGAVISAAGEDSKGIWVFPAQDSGGVADVVLGEGVSVTTSDASGHGIQASNVGAKAGAVEGLRVEATGGKSFGVVTYHDAEIELKGGTILAPDHYAVYATAADDTGTSKIRAAVVQHFEGVVYAGANSDIGIVYADGSCFKGATGVTTNGILDFEMSGAE